MSYDAFISYSHGADLALAKQMREGLQKLSKPWNRRRALSVFLDQTSLELSSELGDSLDNRIDDTEWLVLLMSEHSAKSKWVGAEIKEWADAKSKNKIALVLTEGTVFWDDVAKDFDYGRSTAINETMRGIYTGQDSEPLYLDMTWTETVEGGEENLDLDNPRFRNDIATVSAAIQGKSKDEVEGEDIRQHKKLVRLRRAAISGLAVLTIAAVVATIFAWIQRGEAIEQKAVAVEQARRSDSRATAADALNNADTEADLAALLALESGRIANTADARGALAGVLSESTRFLERVDEHEAPVKAISFSETGRLAATADVDGVVRVWDVNPDPLSNPQAVVRPQPIETEAAIRELIVFDDESLLLFAADGSFALIDDLATCETECDAAIVDAPTDFVIAVLAPDATQLAGQAADGTIVLYPIDIVDGEASFGESNMLTDSIDQVSDLAFSPDGSALGLSVGSDVVLWSNADDEPSVISFATDVTSIAFSPDNDPAASPILAVGEESGSIQLVDRADPTLTATVTDPAVNLLNDVAFRPGDADGVYSLTSVHSNGEVILWDVVAEGTTPFGYRVETLLGHNDEALAVGFSPDGRIMSADFNGESVWWTDVATASLGLPLGDIRFDDLGTVIAFEETAFVDAASVAARDVTGAVWLVDVVTLESDLVRDEGDVQSLDAAGGKIATGLTDGRLLILNPQGDESVELAPGHSVRVEYVAMSAAADRLVSVSIDEEFGDDGGEATVLLWDLSGGDQPDQLDLPAGLRPHSAFVTERLVLIGGQTADDLPVAILFDPLTGDQVGSIDHSQREGNFVSAMALSADGITLAIASGDRRISLWDAATYERRTEREFRGHRGNITGVVFWDNGDTLISADDAGQVLMWDVSEQRSFARLGGPTNGLQSLAISAGDSTVVAGGQDGSVWTWRLDTDIWRERACQLAARNMTPAEWELFGDGSTQVRHCSDFPIAEPFVDAIYGEELTD